MGGGLLYVTYGPQSGVVDAVTRRMAWSGVAVERYDVSKDFLFKRRWRGRQVPNLRWDTAAATLIAMKRYRRHWRHYYYHSCFAFDRMSARMEAEIERRKPGAVLQAGCLFGPRASRQHFLYLDHTRAIAERYEPVPGELPAIPFQRAWRDREAGAYRKARGIFVMSEHVKGSLVRDYGVDEGKVHVVGAGPNVEPGAGFEPALAREPAFLFVGLRFFPKGGPSMLEAFARVRAQHPEAELWMVTNDPPPLELPGVHFFARMPHVELAGLYARAACFVLPTLREAFGLSFLEAMSFGLPCIGSAIEAIPEIIQDGVTGRLVRPGDPVGLAAAMLEVLRAPERARAMGELGRRRVRERYGWERTVERILGVLSPGVA